jgi:hypothetical protein
MTLDKIIVIAMAVAFFGGIIWLGIKSRQDKSRASQPPASPDQNNERANLPYEPREKERRKFKN